MRNSRNIKRRSRKSSPTRDKERRAISSDNTKRRIKRSMRGHDGRIRSYMKRISRIQNHGDVPDCVDDGGRAVLEESVTEPAAPGEEEPEGASNRLSRTISCSVKVAGEESDEPKDARVPGETDAFC
jgi:hypothetical protein